MVNKNEGDVFSDNPLMIGYNNRIFEGDETLGFRFPDGKLITSQSFAPLEEIIRGVRTGYPTFLNIGDSSTSGWNSNRTFKGNQDQNAPFFSYKTYSKLLEEQLFANVFNAGVPGYTSHQGKKSLHLLLKKIAKSGIKVDYVTIYLGNNDCTYNQCEDRVRLDAEIPSESSRGERVTVEDYKRNIREMIETCRAYG
ncbi:SGNH/GDSL hydrolase family protein, partial [Candidatus Woesearchaeota archaeon]|nr:SGNH/GDSL hydrolase family protein [Candidatus Woesearchaeota archaeon]